jgi:hypothetical protein
MSSIPGGGANIFIDAGQTQPWTLNLGTAGWQGNVLIEAQPLSPQVTLTCVQEDVEQSGGIYLFSFAVKNTGKSGAIYNIQVSAS